MIIFAFFSFHLSTSHAIIYLLTWAKTPLFKMWLANQHFCNIGVFCCKLKQYWLTCIAGGLFVSQSSVPLLRNYTMRNRRKPNKKCGRQIPLGKPDYAPYIPTIMTWRNFPRIPKQYITRPQNPQRFQNRILPKDGEGKSILMQL